MFAFLATHNERTESTETIREKEKASELNENIVFRPFLKRLFSAAAVYKNLRFCFV